MGFLVGPPAGATGFGGGPVDDEGNPVGAGDESLLDLVPSRVIALLVGLGGAFLLYALSRGRRLGAPVLEPVPIELPSSTYTEAVGRLYARTENAAQRSAAILRADLRIDLARRVGMSSEASASDLAGALGSAADRGALIELLDGSAPANDGEFVELAAALSTTRERVDRGGMATLLVSDGISLESTERKVTERTNDD